MIAEIRFKNMFSFRDEAILSSQVSDLEYFDEK